MSARPVATGAITLDRDKAKEKLRRFQLADPCAWLLELVRAAVVQGATGVTIRTDADDVRVAFDGAAFTVADLDDLYQALLARSAPPARQHLAVALNGAMALNPRFVELTSRGPNAGVRMRLVPGQPDAFGASGDDVPQGTTVWLRHPFRVGAFVEFFRARLGTQREIEALRRGCRFSRVPVTVNQRPIGWSPPKRARGVVSDKGLAHGLVFATGEDGEDQRGLMVFTVRGVVLEEGPHDLLPAGVCAVLSADHLTRDASLAACVRDQAWSSLVDHALVAALELCEEHGGELLRRAAVRLGPAVLADVASGDPLASMPTLRAALAKRARPLLSQAVLRGVDDTDITLHRLRTILRAGRPVATAPRQCRVARSGDPIALVCNDDDQRLLTHLVGDRHTSGEMLLAEAERRDRGLSRLRQRRATLALPPGDVFGRARRSAAGAQGIVALRVAGTRLRLALHRDGCLIGVHDLDCPLPGLSMALEAPFTLAPDCGDVVRDRVFTRALHTGFAGVPDALRDACGNAADRQALAVRALPLLAWCIDPEALWAKLAATLSLAAVDDLPPLSTIDLDGPERHPVTGVPCVPRVDGTLASLDQLRGTRVRIVPANTETFSLPDAVRAGDVLRAVLSRVADIEQLDERAAREGRRARLLREPATLRTPHPPVATFSVGDGTRGWVGFGAAAPGIQLEAFIEGRALPPIRFGDTNLGSLRIVVDDPQLLPLAGGGLAATDARRLVRAGLGAAGALIESAPAAPGAGSRGRRLALAVVTSVAPSAVLARAVEALSATEFLALRALTLATASRDLEPLIELALEAGLRPTVDDIRDLARAAGTTLPKRGATDHDARALLLAPLGGLRALRAFDDATPLRDRVLQRIPALASLELRAFDGAVTLQSILAAGGPVRFVPAGFLEPDGTVANGRVLRLTAEEHDALRALLGPSALVDAVGELREQAARRTHEAKAVEVATLERALHTEVIELSVDRARGELGLLPPTSSTPAASVRLLSGGRFVKRLDLSNVAPCSFAAVLDDPELPVVLDGEHAARRMAVLGAYCVGAVEGAIDSMVARLTAERPDARARSCLLERLAQAQAHPIEAARLAELSGAPLVDTIHGRWASLEQVRTDAQRQRTIACVTAAPRGEPPRALALVMPVMFHRELLASAAGAPIEDITAEWRGHVDRQAALGRYPPLPSAPADAVDIAVASVAGVRATLWWGPSTTGSKLAAGIEAREVGAVEIETVLPAVAGTVVGEAVLDATFSFVSLARAWPAIDVAATALATRLVELHGTDAGTDAALDDWRRRLVLRLAATPDAHGKRMGALLGRLRTRSLFLAPDGGSSSLDQVLATRPQRHEAELLAHGLVPPTESDRAPVTPPPPQAPPPEQELAARLAELMTLLSLDEGAKAQLARWPLLVVRRKGAQLVRFTRLHCEVDVEHVLGRAALAGDPAALDLVCAVIVGAANQRIDEIDASHERAFLMRLIAHAATRGA